MIFLTKAQYQEILTYCLDQLPNEACGLLGGRLDGEDKIVEKVYLLTNLDHSPEHFSMDPQEQFRAIKDIRQNGWELLGNFHSHPETPARPSEEDKRLAYDPTASYLILSLQDQANAVLKSFEILKDKVTEQKIIIEGE